MSNAFSSVGVQFRRWDADATSAAGAWVKLAEVTGIDGPGKSKETIDVTSLDSTGGYREFISSFRDGGTVSLEMNFTSDTYDVMDEDFEADTTNNYEIVFPDAGTTSFEFTGIVTELSISASVGSQVTSSVSIKVTGQITKNSGSGS